MAKTLPVNFAIPSENVISSYSFIDLAGNTGIIKFYGGKVKNSSTEAGVLVTNQIYSDSVQTTYTAGSGSGTDLEANNIDFYTTFNKPIVLNGQFTANIPGIVTGGNPGGANSQRFYFTVTISKVSGATTTQIATTTTSTLIRSASSTYDHEFMFYCSANITETLFKRGDQLKINVTQTYTQVNTSGSVYYTIGHDPQNRITTLNTNGFTGTQVTQLVFYIPVKIDI